MSNAQEKRAKLAYSPDDLIEIGVCANRNAVYSLLARGEFASWKEGKRRFIVASSVDDYIKRKVG